MVGHSLNFLMEKKMEHLCKDLARSSIVDRRVHCEVPKGMLMDLPRTQEIWTICQGFRGDVWTKKLKLLRSTIELWLTTANEHNRTRAENQEKDAEYWMLLLHKRRANENGPGKVISWRKYKVSRRKVREDG